jgi:hypothetical protein
MSDPPSRRPVGRPPSPEPLRTVQFKLSEADLARLTRIAERLAGPTGVPNQTEAIRYLIRKED